MDKAQRKILRSPSVKRKNKTLPIGQKLTLERVLGLTVSSNAAFSCDPINGTIAYPAGCVVVLFNPRRNRQSHIFNVSKKTITSLAFSADGKYLVTGECGHQPAVRVWDVEEKTQVAEFHGHKFGINCVAFSPHMKYIVSIGTQHDMMVNVWNWRTGSKVASNKVSCKVNAVAFGADSLSFVTVGNRHVKFWYLDNSKSKINQTVPLLGRSGILGEQKNNFFCDVVCGRGKLAGITYVITQSGLLCEFNEKRLLDKWVELRTKCANCLAAGEDHIYIGCAEGVVRVFSASSLNFVTSLPHPHHLGVDVASATSSSDLICTETDAKYPDVIAITLDDDHQKVACIYNDHSLYVWDVLNVRRVGKAWSFLFHSGCVWGVEVYPSLENQQTGVLPAGSFLTASSDDTIRIWNLDPQMTETSGYKRNIFSSELLKVVYTDPSYTFLCDVNYNPAGATDKTDTTWDGKNGVRSIRVSPDGEHLASGDRQGNVRIYDLRQMAEIRSIEAHESDVVCLEYSFSKAGPKILASGSRDRLIHVFDVEQHYGLLQTLDDHSAAIQSVRFTDANNKLRMLSCGSDKSLLFRNAALNPGFEFSLDQHLVSKATMYDMIIDPTQKFVATACQDRNIRVYNMATAKQKKNYRGSAGDEGTLLRVQLDPSGTYAATSCTDKNLAVLEFYTGELTASVFGHSEIATGLRFTNDLKHLISVSADGCIFVWRLPSDMTKTMRSRMEELGKMPQEESFVADLSSKKGASLMPNPVSLDATFTTSSYSSQFQVMKENISPSRILSSMDLPASSFATQVSTYPTTPVGKRMDPNPLQPSPADCRFSVGPLPNWAKAKFGEDGDKVDGPLDSKQPKGRWAQRFDQNLAFKSQLDLTQLDEESDQRRLTGFEPLHTGELHTSMPDLRRETVVLSPHLPATKNIPIIDDDDETNVDDDEDFFPAYLNKKLAGTTAESDRSSSDHDDRQKSRKSDPLGRRSDGLVTRRWGSRVSLGNEDKTSSFEFDDTDDFDTWSETTEVIYPPSEPESVDTYASTYQVFEGGKKKTRRTSNINADEDSESTDQVSLEEDDDPNDETLATSNASTPSDPDREFFPRTPDKEQFLKENFESVSFTPVAMDKFAQQVATLERAAEVGDPANMPFSPRLSLSSRFLSRSQFGVVRSGGGLVAGQRPESWLNPMRRTKTDMARAMDETRRHLADMNWHSRELFKESPEQEDPPSPPTKLENKEPNFSASKVSPPASGPGTCGSPSPRTLRRFWADFTLPHQPIREEHPLPRIPVPQTLNHLRGERSSVTVFPVNGSKIPLATCSAELQPLPPTDNKQVQPPLSSDPKAAQSPCFIQSHEMKPVGISGGTPPQSQRLPNSNNCRSGNITTPGSTPPQSPRLVRSLDSKSTGISASSSITPPQSPRSGRSRVTTKPPRSPHSPDLRSPQSCKFLNSSLSPKPPVCPSSPRPPRTPLTLRLSRQGQSPDLASPQSPKPPRSPISVRPPRSLSHSPDMRSPKSSQPPKKPPRSLPPLRSSSYSPSRSGSQSPSNSCPPSPSPDSTVDGEGKQPPKKPPRTLLSMRSRSKSPQSPSSSHPSSPTLPAQADGNRVRESARSYCRSRPMQNKGSDSAAAGGKLERETSSVTASPTRGASAATARTTPPSPTRGVNPLASKEKRQSGNGINGGSTAPSAPVRQVPSYFRTTKSSRLKSSSSNLMVKQADNQNGRSSNTGLGGNKNEVTAKKRIGKGKLSSSLLSMYASTPNLANFREEDEHVVEAPKPTAEAPSNLRALAELSFSVPDIKCLDDATSTDSSTSSSASAPRDKGLQGTRTYSPNRRSLPAGGLEGTELRLLLANQGREFTDAQLMPPPTGPVSHVSKTQSSSLRRAIQVRKKSASELTLEQAKSILLGNSGILGSQQLSPAEETLSSSKPLLVQALVHSAGSDLTQRTVSSVKPVSSRANSSHVATSSSKLFESSDPAGYTPASTLAVAEEIDRTANQLRRERERAAAAALDASRFDPPERDKPLSRKQQPSQVGTVNSMIHVTPLSDSVTSASVSGEDAKSLSVRERIARLNQQSPKQGISETGRSFVDNGRSQSPSLLTGGASQVPALTPTPPEQQISPRSQSDTGLGSDTDTDSEMRQYQHKNQASDGANVRGDRSRLSLHLQNSSPQPATAPGQESLPACTRVVAELKLAIHKAKEFHSQVQNNSQVSSSDLQEMMCILSEAFHEAHFTLAELALQSPVGSDDSESRKSLSCPLVGEAGASALDSSLMDKARDMMQPFMSHLSRDLSEELVKIIKERLKQEGSQPR